ncbi:hypothetical protein [Neobacillus niacini]|uniref:hypothetical protein n=1 Tax=Neobacillus niacini TaxID=86668 RepID=UPI0027D8B5D5|nr:hypothetical protein [Neobacillus niacini]
MKIKSEINYLQKRLLDRLNVRKGTTMFTIIEAITRQAYVKESFVVSQKNSTLAIKCNVTASTISRNLKKIKEQCSDLLIIEQNRNIDERFASLIFTFIPQKMSNGISNGEQSEPVKDFNESYEVAKFTSSLSTNHLVLSKNINIDLHTNIVNKDVDNSKIIYEIYLEYASKGISKAVFQRVLNEIGDKKGINNYIAYLRGVLNNVVYHRDLRKGNFDFKYDGDLPFYDWINQ